MIKYMFWSRGRQSARTVAPLATASSTSCCTFSARPGMHIAPQSTPPGASSAEPCGRHQCLCSDLPMAATHTDGKMLQSRRSPESDLIGSSVKPAGLFALHVHRPRAPEAQALW